MSGRKSEGKSQGLSSKVNLVQEVAEKVEKLKQLARDTGEWQNVIIAGVEDPAQVNLELVVSPPDENGNQLIFLRLRTARFNNAMKVTPLHIQALTRLVEIINEDEELQALMQILASNVQVRRRRTLTFKSL